MMVVVVQGLELAFQRVPGVVGTRVGYTQGQQDAPTYSQVCSGEGQAGRQAGTGDGREAGL